MVVEVSEFGVCLDTEVLGGSYVLLLVSVIVSVIVRTFVFDMCQWYLAIEIFLEGLC